MNTAIAVTADLCRTAVILAGIWAGRGFLIALAPQLRIAAPQKTPQPQADTERPMSITGGESRGEAA